MACFSKQRDGFALITAIIVMMIIAVLGGLMVSLSTQSVAHTQNNYLHEQAQLLAKSATEFALLAISAHDINATGNCVNSINSQYPHTSPIFDINTTIRYIGYGVYDSNCNQFIENIYTSESNGTVLIDVYVTTNSDVGLSEQIMYHKRTLQKP